MFFSFAILIVAATVQAAPVNSDWVGGATGNWNDAANWSSPAFPNNGADNYSVTIDNTVTNVSVNLNVSATIDNLNVTSGDTLNFNNVFDLTIDGGNVINNGTVNMNGVTSNSDFNFFNGANIAGNGELVLLDNTLNRILSDSGVITHGAGHTIRGSGTVLGNTGGMINDGIIRATGSVSLTLDPDANGFVNNGLLRGEGSGGLVLAPGSFTNTSGTIEALTGSRVDLGTNVSLIGGTLQSSGTGVIRVRGSGSNLQLTDITVNATTLQDNGFDAVLNGTFKNNGVWTMNGTTTDTDLLFQGGMTLDGTGEIVVVDDTVNRITTDGSTLVHGANHTITGPIKLLNNTGGMINNGTIIANGTIATIIDPGAAANFTNQGTLRAVGTGGLSFAAGDFINTGHTIEVEDNSILDLNQGVILTGGTLQTSGSGIVDIQGSGTNLRLTDVTFNSTTRQNNGFDVVLNGAFVNNGVWSLNGLTTNTDMLFENGMTVDGVGEIIMSDDNVSRIETNATVLTHGVGHTIRGAGQLLNNTGGMVNNGTIIADGVFALNIDPSAASSFVNQGVLQATGTGGLNFGAGEFVNTGNTIEIADASRLNLNQNVTVTGGTIQTTGSGVVNVLGSGTNMRLSNVTMNATTVQNNGFDVVFDDTFNNNGTWNLNGITANTDMRFEGGMTLDGTGEIVMTDDNVSRIVTDGSVMTHGAGHTIRGSGLIGMALMRSTRRRPCIVSS